MWGGDGATSRPGVGALALAFYDKAPLIAIHRAQSTAPALSLDSLEIFPKISESQGPKL